MTFAIAYYRVCLLFAAAVAVGSIWISTRRGFRLAATPYDVSRTITVNDDDGSRNRHSPEGPAASSETLADSDGGGEEEDEEGRRTSSSTGSTSIPRELLEATDNPRLHRLKDPTRFPVPKFHGCSEQSLCTMSNVCYSHKDGMLVFDVPGLDNKVDFRHEFGYDPFLIPTKPYIIPTATDGGSGGKSSLSKWNKIYFTKSMFVMNCWRQSDGFGLHTPHHVLLAYGKLFTASGGHYGRNFTVDMLLFHQCPPIGDWTWARDVEKLVFDDAVSNGFISNMTSSVSLQKDQEQHVKIYRPVPSGRHLDWWNEKPTAYPNHNDYLICGETVYTDPFHYSAYFGPNDKRIADRWRSLLQEKLVVPPSPAVPAARATTKTSSSSSRKAATLTKEGETSVSPSCPPEPRIAIWQRQGKKGRERHITNLHEVQDLVVREFNFSQPAGIRTANKSMSLQQHLTVFNSFDILITTDGSHLSNMILGSNTTVYIDVLAVYFFDNFENNARHFTAGWIPSYGHTPMKRNNAAKGTSSWSVNTHLMTHMPNCAVREHIGIDINTKCSFQLREEFHGSSLQVNVNTIRKDLRHAIEIFTQKAYGRNEPPACWGLQLR